MFAVEYCTVCVCVGGGGGRTKTDRTTCHGCTLIMVDADKTCTSACTLRASLSGTFLPKEGCPKPVLGVWRAWCTCKLSTACHWARVWGFQCYPRGTSHQVYFPDTWLTVATDPPPPPPPPPRFSGPVPTGSYTHLPTASSGPCTVWFLILIGFCLVRHLHCCFRSTETYAAPEFLSGAGHLHFVEAQPGALSL